MIYHDADHCGGCLCSELCVCTQLPLCLIWIVGIIRVVKILSLLGFLLWSSVMTVLEFQPVFLQSTNDAPLLLFQLVIVNPFSFNRPAFNLCNDFDHVPCLRCAHVDIVVVRLHENPVR